MRGECTIKLLISLLLIFPLIGVGQQKKSYLHAYGGLSWSNEATTKGIAGVSGGPRIGNDFGFGFGIGFIQFTKPYFPLTLDLSWMPIRKKVNPIAGIKAGYGAFRYDPGNDHTVRGGFVSTAFAGITLGAGKIRPNLTIGGTRYTFKSKYTTRTIATDDKRLFAAIGILF